jgi:hypothetical protein
VLINPVNSLNLQKLFLVEQGLLRPVDREPSARTQNPASRRTTQRREGYPTSEDNTKAPLQHRHSPQHVFGNLEITEATGCGMDDPNSILRKGWMFETGSVGHTVPNTLLTKIYSKRSVILTTNIMVTIKLFPRSTV